MVDYYEVLGVERNASFKAIRNQFRRKAKQIHPDVSKLNKQDSEEAMRQLLIAYNVLSNPQKRRNYDAELQKIRQKMEFNYRDFLKSSSDDLRLQSRLIFYDLLNGNSLEAINLYEKLSLEKDFKLEQYLNYGDYMDCTFLLAEEFEKQKKYLEAFRHLKKIFLNESIKPYFHHFTEEITDRMRLLVLNKLQPLINPTEYLALLEELIDLKLPTKDKAVFCKKIAELYYQNGKRIQARRYLRKGLFFDKKLAGTKKLSIKIGLVGAQS